MRSASVLYSRSFASPACRVRSLRPISSKELAEKVLRHISLLERDGQPLRVVIPYERARKVGVLTPRSEVELQALKAQVSR